MCIHIRFDKGFDGEEFYAFWEAKTSSYVGKLKWTKRVLCYNVTTRNKTKRVAVIRKMQRYADDHPQCCDPIHRSFTISDFAGCTSTVLVC